MGTAFSEAYSHWPVTPNSSPGCPVLHCRRSISSELSKKFLCPYGYGSPPPPAIYVSPDNVGLLSSKSSAGSYSGILKRKTQLGDISEDVQPFLLSDEACWRVEDGALYFSREHCS